MNIFGITRSDWIKVIKIFKMSMKNRYMGSRMGFIWAILNPLFQMAIYIVVFGFVMKAKVPGSEQSLDYVIWFISGFAPWMAINEGINMTATSVTSNIQLVKSFSFKSELLPISMAFMGLPQMIVGLILVIILSFITGAGISIHILWIPFLVLIMFAFLAGIGFILSATTVYKRDLIQIIPTVLMLFIFFTPIFYTLEQLPWIVQKVTFFNPINQICAPFRAVLIEHTNPDLYGIFYLLIITIFLWVFGLRYFRKLKGYFESAL